MSWPSRSTSRSSTLGRQTRLRSITIYGGVGLTPQIQALRAGPEIVVACPGRLLDHIRQGTVNLSGVEVLVLDEADRMFDMGFLPDVRRIVRAVPEQRQTLLFSATMPDDIRGLAGEVLRDPLTVQIGHAAPVETVSHAIYPVAQHLKTALLTELLGKTGPGSVLVFTRTKHRAKRVAQQLQRAGFDATSLQGNLSQNQRQAALDGFRAGDFRIMVATDIAARGIDVLSISHVINYDMPDTVDAYTHRIGRTGRAEQTGTAFTLVTQDDVNEVRAVEQVLGYKLERRILDGFDYRAPAPAQDREFARDPRPQSTRDPQRSSQPGQPQRGPRQAPEPFAGAPAVRRGAASAGLRAARRRERFAGSGGPSCGAQGYPAADRVDGRPWDRRQHRLAQHVVRRRFTPQAVGPALLRCAERTALRSLRGGRQPDEASQPCARDCYGAVAPRNDTLK